MSRGSGPDSDLGYIRFRAGGRDMADIKRALIRSVPIYEHPPWLSAEGFGRDQFAHPQRSRGQHNRIPARTGGEGTDHVEVGQVSRRGFSPNSRKCEPWHEQALCFVTKIAIVVAIRPLRRDLSQVA